MGADSLRIEQPLIVCSKNKLSVISASGRIEQSNQAFCHGRVQLHVEIVDHEYRFFTKSVKEWTCKRQKLTSFIRLLRSKIKLNKSSGFVLVKEPIASHAAPRTTAQNE